MGGYLPTLLRVSGERKEQIKRTRNRKGTVQVSRNSNKLESRSSNTKETCRRGERGREGEAQLREREDTMVKTCSDS